MNRREVSNRDYDLDTMLQGQQCTSVMFTDGAAKARFLRCSDVAHRSGDFVIFAPDCNEEPALLLNTANNFRDAYRFKTMIRGVAYPVPIFSVKRRNTALPLLSRTPPIDITLTGQEVQS